MRHLAGLGFRLAYEQDPRTEFDFGVASLATDLRSGVRLLRLTELLTGRRQDASQCRERACYRLFFAYCTLSVPSAASGASATVVALAAGVSVAADRA